MKELATESLVLLEAALPAQAASFPALFSLPLYGALIGMFELNNLGAYLVLQSRFVVTIRVIQKLFCSCCRCTAPSLADRS